MTCTAAGLQIARTAMQHRLRALLSVSGAGFVRYLYGAPLSLAAVLVCLAAGLEIPSLEARFWPTIAAAALAQILGTIFLIRAFDARDFAIGTVLSKTEVLQVAVFSLVLLGEPLHVAGWVGALVCTFGVVLFAFTVSALWLKERHTRGEYLASALIATGVAGVMLAG